MNRLLPYWQDVPSKTLQVESPLASLQLFSNVGEFLPRISTTISIMPAGGNLEKCGLAASLASTASSRPCFFPYNPARLDSLEVLAN